MAQKVAQDVIREKLIIDSNTGAPVKGIELNGEKIKVVKESGEVVEIPLNTIRGKYIKMRLEAGLGEITEPIYV
ncbi:hypothetical protein BCF55_0773 [Hydrogenivirga caldilitoris]|uniref:Uncharacterized protein n=1 Tax=Hydrogenivirga caldilitoris TaxID=246264 RepID=A0A497XNQ3_9AQUI|nr:hypothetical protein [Hydrogenivirga caldilitoris]RLJ70498.1 hypothetical protein BCF55_0773 [Hydrogenivirga caldilitoris]